MRLVTGGWVRGSGELEVRMLRLLWEFNIALKVNSSFREGEEFRGEFTKTRAQAEVAGNCLRAIPLTS